ncbi:hypothetical protein LguiA_015248 [Lonicera macranthoides]
MLNQLNATFEWSLSALIAIVSPNSLLLLASLRDSTKFFNFSNTQEQILSRQTGT